MNARTRTTPGVAATVAAVLLLAASAAVAQETGRSLPSPEGALEDLGLLHRDGPGAVCNEFWVLGRYHGQQYWSDGGAEDAEAFESRRFRLGAQARFFDNLTVHAQAISGSDFDPEYNGFTELWVGWRFCPELMLTVGQQKHRFTHDRNVSSRYLNYLERSQLTNMFAADYTPAVTLQGQIGRWNYYGGLFSNATGRDMVGAFTELDSGESWLGFVTYDFGRAFGTDSAFWNVSAVRSDANANATNLNWFDEGLATALILTDGPGSLVTELTSGFGNPRGDVLGINLQPGWFVTDQLQLVARLQLAGSDGDDGLRAQRRYEREVGLSTGDFYQATYLGLNQHFAGHRIKVLTGVEYATLGGDECWTFSVAFRMFFGPHSRGPFPMGDLLPASP